MIRNSKLEIENSLTKDQTFFVKIFGCQYNEWDGDRLIFALKNAGMIESTEKDAETIFLVNCSVRKSAVDRALGVAENYKDQHKEVVVSGCLLKEDKARFSKKGVKFLEDFSFLNLNNEPISNKSNLIPIMKGCDNFCSYCVVPYTRGREISRPIDEVISDAKKIVLSGQKEIWLLGQNVNSYQSPPSVIPAKVFDSTQTVSSSRTAGILSKNNNLDFADLLKQLNDLSGNFQIFFTSNHPKDMSDDIISAIKDLPKVAKIIHLPVQSGSDKVLRSMNRPYTREQYLELVEKIKKQIPEIKITTDFIVGYPTETDEDFQESVNLAKTVGFHQAFVNKYSPREGTKSFALGDPIAWSEKQCRWRVLNDLINKGDK